MRKIIVIGCGAAGMMAAVAAAQSGASAEIYEKNDRPGRKIYITGKGRCNLTNACDTQDFFGAVRNGSKFLYSAVYGFDAAAVQEFFESHGCRLKVERGERVFPVSDHSSDIIRTLTDALQELGVRIHYGQEVRSILMQDGRATGISVRTEGGIRDVSADAVIIATGGMSYPTTGSTGDGYRFAKAAGHSVSEAQPSLVPLETAEDWCRELQGLSLKNVTFTMKELPEAVTATAAGDRISGAAKSGRKRKDKPVYEGFGEMLFTHFGLSGPLILTASTYMKPGMRYAAELDLKPALTEEQLDKRLIRDFEASPQKEFRNSLKDLLPSSLIPVALKLFGKLPEGMPGETRVCDLTGEQRRAFVHLLKHLPMTITGTRSFAEAIVTRGGVTLKEVDPSTMESKLLPGLYFAGEVLDADAVTGGFNLQIAWSTGHLAGESAATE